MPTYHARGVTIRLSTSGLDETITPDENLMRRKGVRAAANVDKAETILRKESVNLAEENVSVAEDTHLHKVHFFSPKATPFLQVRVRADLLKSKAKDAQPKDSTHSVRVTTSDATKDEAAANASTSLKRSHQRAFQPGIIKQERNDGQPSLSHELRSAAGTGASLPRKALCLHVILSNLTYLSSSVEGQPQSLKVEVFFNGMIVQSVLMIPRDVRAGVKPNHQIFAGTRIAQLAERPWVVSPSSKNAGDATDGSSWTSGAEDRWWEISATLLAAAENRGVNLKGEKAPSATYLEQLARMDMPVDIESFQRPGGKKFGVIDVIVTAGSGGKAGGNARYLHEPLPLRDDNYRVGGSVRETSDLQENVEPEALGTKLAPSEMDADRETDSEFMGHDNNGDGPPDWKPPPRALFALGAVTPDEKLSAPMPMTASQGSQPQVPVASMYPMAAPTPLGDPFVYIDPYLAAGESHHSLSFMPPLPPTPAECGELGYPFGVEAANSGPLPSAMYIPAEAPAPTDWNTPIGWNQDSFSSVALDGAGLPLQDARPRPYSGARKGLASQNLSTSKVFLMDTALRPGFPFAGPFQLGDTNPLQFHHLPPPGPPPPVGVFSAPPERKFSAAELGIIDSSLPRPSFCLSRLVIYRACEVIVDHCWVVPQLIRRSYQSFRQDDNSDFEPDSDDYVDSVISEGFSEAEYKEPPVAKRKRRLNARRKGPATPPPTSPVREGAQNVGMDVPHRVPNFAHHGQTYEILNFDPTLDSASKFRSSLHSLFPVAADGRRNSNATICTPDHSGLGRRDLMAPPGLLDPALLTSQTQSSPHLIAEPSPSAVVADLTVLDDPDSPLWNRNRPSSGAQIVHTRRPVALMQHRAALASKESQRQTRASVKIATPTMERMINTDFSSPLSSVPETSSVLDDSSRLSTPLKKVNRRRQTIKKPLSCLNMATGPRPRINPTENRCGSNPALNEDSVIAYAQGETSMLRQVRCERQGWFYETEVVVGMRFFVTG